MRVKVLVAGAMLAATTIMVAPASSGAGTGETTGGPITIMGIDAEDGGVGGHGPITVYENLVNGMFGNVANGNSAILVLGGGKDANDDVTEFWDQIGADLGRTITYANGDDVGTQTLDGFGLVAIPSSVDETPSGGLTDAESELLKARSLEFAFHVNTGGGLLVFSQTGQTTPYGFIADVAPITRDDIDAGDDTDVDITAEGSSAGLTDELDICCWHDQYTDYPGFLGVLATYSGSNEIAALGGANVLIPSGIELAPATQEVEVGANCAITATVTEDEAPVAGAEVTFDVTDGPAAGTTEPVTTDADGIATFEFPTETAGLNVVVGSFVDSLERTQDASAECTVVAPAAEPEPEPEVLGERTVAQPAAPAAEPAAPVRAQPAFTG